MGNKQALESGLNLTKLKYIPINNADIVSNTEQRLVVDVITLAGYRVSKTYLWHELNKIVCFNEMSTFVTNDLEGKIGLLVESDVIVGLVKQNGEILSCIDYLKNKTLELIQ